MQTPVERAAAMRLYRTVNRDRLLPRERERSLRRFPRKSVLHSKTSVAATRSPTINDLYWAAGFMEGEGSFIRARNSQYVCAPQRDGEPAKKMLALFGGTLRHRATDKRWPDKFYWDWRAYGARARGIMLTLYPLMSARRQAQIRVAFFGDQQ